MILIPIGHEESTVRRLPGVTFAIIGLCLVCFLATGRGMLFAEDDVSLSGNIDEAVQYYVAHPYLELDDGFRELVFTDSGEAAEWLDTMRQAIPAPTDAETLADEQQELNRLVDAALRSYDSHPLMRWGLIPGDVSPLTLLTHIFLHVGWMHLLGNMLLLYLAGPFIEDVWGRPLYLGFYVAAGVVAALAHVGAQPSSTAPLVGASGAIAGVMGAFLVRYHNTKIRFFYMVGLFWRGTFAAPAWLMLPLWFGAQLLLATTTAGGGGGGVAYWAHIGGFTFGVAFAGAMAWQRVEQRFLAAGIEGRIVTGRVDHARIDAAMERHARGESSEALASLIEEVAVDPSNPDAARALWAVASESEQVEAAAPALLDAVRSLLQRRETDAALEIWHELTTSLPALPVEPRLGLRLAQASLLRDGSQETLVELRRALLGCGGKPPAAVALKVAGMARGLDDGLARTAVRLALADRELDPAGRELAQRLLSELEQGVTAGA